MAYIRFTKNPKNETNDCIIRSIANARDMEWQDVMREMCDIAIELYEVPNAIEVATTYMEKYGFEETYHYPSDNITVEKFCSLHPTGSYVLVVQDHAVSVKDGDYYDLVNSGSSKVLSYWTISC